MIEISPDPNTALYKEQRTAPSSRSEMHVSAHRRGVREPGLHRAGDLRHQGRRVGGSGSSSLLIETFGTTYADLQARLDVPLKSCAP